MSIASKEARETNYWLRLLRDSKFLIDIDYDDYIGKCEEINKNPHFDRKNITKK